jgi:hypothetical protein
MEFEKFIEEFPKSQLTEKAKAGSGQQIRQESTLSDKITSSIFQRFFAPIHWPPLLFRIFLLDIQHIRRVIR